MAYADVLPYTTPKYEFKGIQHLLQIVEGPEEQDEQCEGYMEGYMESRNPYIIFTIDERSFLDCLENPEARSLRQSWECYDPSINELLIKIMESGPHGVGTTAFADIFHAWRGPYNLKYPIESTGTIMFRGNSKKKRADCSWRPEHSGLDRKWPTIAVEVAYTETPAKMIEDVEFWLNDCSGQVNIVLTVKIHKRSGKISIQQWKMGARAPFPVQKLEIARNPAPNCEKIQGSMRLSFEDIHLRPKGPNDTDLVISHQDIEILAGRVWRQQDREAQS